MLNFRPRADGIIRFKDEHLEMIEARRRERAVSAPSE
jgi:hypothetical protein